MSAKVVAQSSDKTIVKKRIPLRDGINDDVLGPALIIGVPFAVIGIPCPLNLFAHFDLLNSFLWGGGVVGSAYAIMFALGYASETADWGEDFSPGKVSSVKSFVNTVLPFGQTVKVGKKLVKFKEERQNIARLERGRISSSESDVTHEVTTTIKYTPMGAYIEQEFTTQPTKVWDEAFKTTLAVHAFSKTDTNDKKAKSSIRLGK